MSFRKEALIRYRIINRCLIEFDVCSKKQLIKACEEALDDHPLQVGTIENDINEMRLNDNLGYHAPIKFDDLKGGYFYDDINFSIDNLPLSLEELNSLIFAATLLDQYQYLDLFKDFGGIVQKISDALKIRKIGNKPEEIDFIRFDRAPRTRGSQYLPKLINFILEKKVVLLKYQPFYESDPYMVQVHPYLLKEFRFRWYLIGLNEQVQELRTYGFDRILMVEPTDIPYRKKNFDATEYFKNSIGVISPTGKPPEIILVVKKPQAYYLLTKPMHESQLVLKENEEEVVFQFRVHPTWEFTSAVLALGNDAKIIRPASVKEDVKEKLQRALRQYER